MPRRPLLLLALAALLSLPAGGQARDPATGLRAQLHALAARHGFALRNLQRVAEGPAIEVPGEDPRAQLPVLLRDYNYITLNRGDGSLEAVVITSPKAARGTTTAPYIVATRRQGRHHLVQAILTGPNGRRIDSPLIVDTGASSLVLPRSLIETLGFAPEGLRPVLVQTANGQVAAQAGVLPALRLGGTTARDVAVTFMPDEGLGGSRLLGMNFLDRFRFTIDDANDRILLLSK